MTPSREEILADMRACCILNLSCCNPPDRLASREFALAETIYGFSEQPSLPELPSWAHTCAKNLMSLFDFVPAGAGQHVVALAEAYRENFEKTRKKNGK